MKKRASPYDNARRRGNPDDEPWKQADFTPQLIRPAQAAEAPKPVRTASAPTVEAILARLKTQASSLDDLIGYFRLTKLPEQNALEKRLLEIARSGSVQMDRRGRLALVAAAPLAAAAVVDEPDEAAVEDDAPAVAPVRPVPGARAAADQAPAAAPAPQARTPANADDARPSRTRAAEREPTPAAEPAAATPVTKPASTPAAAAPRAATTPAAPVTVGSEVTGRVSAHRDGYGFVVLEPKGPEDVFLPQREMRGLMTGDRVRVRIATRDAGGRVAGEFVAMVSTAPRFVVGRLRADGGRFVVTPDNQKAQPFELVVGRNDLFGAKAGQVVRAEILSPAGGGGSRGGDLYGRITEVVGEHLAPGLEIEIALRRHDLPYEWPDAVLAEAEAYAPEVSEEDAEGRVDLRGLPLVTIDGADSRDFDDAVYAERLRGGGFKLLVAIADVSAYVQVGSALDVEAKTRGTSVYFPRRVIPMLPEAISNGLCSLNPQVDRLCMVCEMKLDKAGEVKSARFYEAVMRSAARLIYGDVAAMLDDPEGALAKGVANAALLPQLQALDAVFDVLFAARNKRGAIDFDSTETRFEFTEDSKIDRIVPVQRNRAHRLIEECMIVANVEAAKFVSADEDLPALYRVHERPEATRIAALKEFLATRAMALGGGELPDAAHFAAVSEGARGRPDTSLIHMMILRTMAQARYAPELLGHFGLALTHYAHFTSPIRRYPDLLLHRAIKHRLSRRKASKFEYDYAAMEQLGLHCSMAERRADEATRDVASWLKCEFMSHRVGERYPGVISAVTAFGVFVELTGLFIDGLVHISTLGDDYYAYDSKTQRLVGKRSGRTFAIGQSLQVQVARVNLEERKIDLMPVGAGGKAQAGERARSSERVHGANEDSPAAALQSPDHQLDQRLDERGDLALEPEGFVPRARKGKHPDKLQAATSSQGKPGGTAPGAARGATPNKSKHKRRR